MKIQILISVKIFVLLTVLLGAGYPLLVTGLAQLAFPDKANGSLIRDGNRLVGSELIGQKFDNDLYFSSRPSSTGYNTLPSGGSNLGPTSSKLKQLVADRKIQFREFNQLAGSEDVPSEMLFASASGLDPHISVAAALLQVDRICTVRLFTEMQKKQLLQLVGDLTESPQFGLFGEERVNVLNLNMKLDKIKNQYE